MKVYYLTWLIVIVWLVIATGSNIYRDMAREEQAMIRWQEIHDYNLLWGERPSDVFGYKVDM